MSPNKELPMNRSHCLKKTNSDSLEANRTVPAPGGRPHIHDAPMGSHGRERWTSPRRDNASIGNEEVDGAKGRNGRNNRR